MPVASIDRDLQKLSLSEALVHQQQMSRKLKTSRGANQLNRPLERDKVVSFNSSPKVKELIITYSDSARRKEEEKRKPEAISNINFNFEEKLLP